MANTNSLFIVGEMRGVAARMRAAGRRAGFDGEVDLFPELRRLPKQIRKTFLRDSCVAMAKGLKMQWISSCDKDLYERIDCWIFSSWKQ